MGDQGRYGREWERTLRRYDELAIRYDLIKKVFDLLGLDHDIDTYETTNKVVD